MALTLVAPFDATQASGSECAGGNAGWESHSSPIDTQCCSESEVIPESETPAIACEVYSVTTNCTESDLDQQIDFNSPKSLATASVASPNGDGEEEQACSSSTPATVTEDSTETYYLSTYQPKTEASSLSPYQPQDSGTYEVTLTEPADPVREGTLSSTLPQERYAEASSIRLVLEDADLWKQFNALGNEMIITKAGRRMFPRMAVSVSGLNAEQKYCFSLEMVPMDSHRYKYLNSKWIQVGKADVHCTEKMKHEHPDNANTGKFWMRQKVSFKKVKLTNNKANKHNHLVLNSMHRYQPRIHIAKYVSKKHQERIFSYDFPESAFIAVTAYQNDQVTQLKIDYNQFAKAFRETNEEHEMYGYPGLLMATPLFSSLSPGLADQCDTTGQATPSSGLPQFSVAFGSWDSTMQATPPYTPNSALRNPNSTLYGCPNPSPVATGFTRSLPTWQYAKCPTESPPISPSIMYSPSLSTRPPSFQFHDAASQTQPVKNFWPCPAPTSMFGFHPTEPSIGHNVTAITRIAGQSPTLTSGND